MQYLGKVIGVAVALLMGGGFWGVVLGFLVGHMFDRARSRRLNLFANQQERQSLFFSTTFEVMGHLTKSKGRVTEADIHVANVLMDRMNLHGASRTAAQQAFRDGKADNYPLREKMRQLRSVCFGRFDLIRMFGGGSQQQSYGQHGGNAGWQQAQRGPTLEDACNVLGVKPTDDAATVKRAYRKLMNEHHPDKLVAKGLPPEMMEMAKQKAQEIQKAWELIKEQRGF